MAQMNVTVDNFVKDFYNPSDVLCNSRTSTGTLITVPANRSWRGSIALTSAITLAGDASCSISASSTGGTNGPILDCKNSGLALLASTNSVSLSVAVIHGGSSGATVTFTQGASGSTSGSIAGALI